jgi:hypothetical protein
MRRYWSLPVLFLGLFCLRAQAADCASYKGSATPATKDVSGVLDKTFAALHTRNAKALFALGDKKVVLLRRVVTSTDRSGNFRLELRQRDFDANMNIHIVNQVLPDLATASVFAQLPTDTLTSVRRDICEDARSCEDSLPGSEQVPFMLSDLLQCNQTGKGIFLYTDGIYMTDMTPVPGKLPVGSALFFNKSGGAYHLAGVIILN